MPTVVMPTWTVARKTEGCWTQGQRRTRAGEAVVSQCPQARLARGNDGDFRHGENTVEQDQKKE
jgi:hypothetical protein